MELGEKPESSKVENTQMITTGEISKKRTLNRVAVHAFKGSSQLASSSTCPADVVPESTIATISLDSSMSATSSIADVFHWMCARTLTLPFASKFQDEQINGQALLG